MLPGDVPVLPAKRAGKVPGCVPDCKRVPGTRCPPAFGDFVTTSLEAVVDDLSSVYEGAVSELRTALESSEERFRVLAESAPIGIVESLRGQISYANPRAAEICGVSVEVLVSGAWTDVLHPDDVAGVVAFFDNARPRGGIAEVTFRDPAP